MSQTDPKTEAVANLMGCALLLFLVPVSIFNWCLTITMVLGWTLPTFGVAVGQAVTWRQVLAALTLVSLAWAYRNAGKYASSKAEIGELVAKAFGNAVVTPLIVLVLAWATTRFL